MGDSEGKGENGENEENWNAEEVDGKRFVISVILALATGLLDVTCIRCKCRSVFELPFSSRS